MRTFSHLSRALLGTLSTSLVLVAAQAQTLSQTPLLTQKGSVEPNLVVSLDTSGSMEAQFMFRYGGIEHGYGRAGPNNLSQNTINNGATSDATNVAAGMLATCPGTRTISIPCAYNKPPSDRYWLLSPDVNSLTYDPRIRYKPRVDSTGTADASGSTAVSAAAITTSTTSFFVYFYKNGLGQSVIWPGTGNDPLNLGSYFNGYKPVQSLLVSGADPNLTYPQKVATGKGPFPRFLNRTDCNGGTPTGGSCSLAEERLNYATWKRYHSNRIDLAKTGLGWAFDQIGPTLRLGWGTIADMDGGNLNKGVSLLTPAHKALFYTWLYSKGASGGTPNLDAVDTMGKYFSRSDNKGPWANTPDASSTGSATLSNTDAGDNRATRKAHLSCRRSYGMLITDGYYSSGAGFTGDADDTASATITNQTSGGTPSSYTYNGNTRPYKGGGSNTLADVAMKYWVNDLRPGLTSDSGNDGIDNTVPVIKDTVVAGVVTNRGNESFWQNMSFYGVGLGVYGTLAQTEAVLNNIRNNVANTNNAGTSVTGWPTAAANAEESMDDMWHATVNGRGRMLSAKNSDTLSDGVESMLADINKVTDSQAGVATSTPSLDTNTRKYSPLYTTGSWTGNIIASELRTTNATVECIAWKINDTVTAEDVAPACAGFTTNGIPAAASRNIYAWNGSGYGDFNSSNTYVKSNVVGGSNALLIDYLRGDQTNEDTSTATKLFRTRTTLLGDIVNSTPTFIQGRLDMGYRNLPTGANGQASYAAFLAQKAARTEGVLFAGANDGMLHGFRDTTGAEVFAFVPKAVMPKMDLLSKRSYNHQYYVDGPTVEADACLGTNGQANKNCTVSEWKNLLLGTLGAGGKSVYAIDVTTLTPSASMGMGASNILWEITTATTGYANLGHIFTEIQTGVTAGGQWVAVFGNGHYSADGVARLYVADLATGTLLKEVSTGVGSGNGLSGPTLVLDSNQRIIGAYAGDLKGNMWKFDLSSTSSVNWQLGLTGSALFAPASGKAITAPPAIVNHPNGGRVVTFGTGKFFDTQDTGAASIASTQTFYGIWDSVAFGDPLPATPVGVVQTDVSNLVQQTTVTATGTYVTTNNNQTTQTVNFTGFTQSKNAINWATKRGWYMNMHYAGERQVYRMKQLFGPASRVYVAGSLIPAATTNACAASQSGSGNAYLFDLLTGGAYDFDLSTPGPDPFPPQPPVPPSPICTTGGPCYLVKPDERNCGTLCNPDKVEFQCGAATGTSCATGIKRSWRQLFMR
jgi:type IV pilus assembly protein PilY1